MATKNPPAGRGGYRKWYLTVRAVDQPDRAPWIITIPRFQAKAGEHSVYQNRKLLILAEGGNRKYAEQCLEATKGRDNDAKSQDTRVQY